MAGWISLHRQIQNHWLWEDKPFDRRSAWIDILLMVNHKDNKFVLGNELVEVERGSLITSEVKLSERWGWSRTKVRLFLSLLEKDNMLVKKADNRKTILTVVNYSDYQDYETTKEQQKNNKRTAKEQQKNTNNNDNNDNNDNNINITLQIKNLRERYSEEQLKTIDEYFDILKWTRKNGKIADSVILKIYQEWEKFSKPKVLYALNIYVSNPKYHDKKENYCYGIMRNATSEEIADKGGKEVGKYGNRIKFDVPKVEREIRTTEELNREIKELGLI